MSRQAIFTSNRPDSSALVSDSDAELRRLAEFGRVGAALIHELSTPLTAASLTLEQNCTATARKD